MPILNVKVKVSALPALLRKLGAEAPLAWRRGMISGALLAAVEMQRRTTEAGVFYTNNFNRSWKSAPLPNGARVHNLAPYAPIIEEGRRPGARPPPSRILVPWVRRKLGVPTKEAEGVAFLLARAIGKRGIPGKHLLATAVPALTRIVTQEAERELKRALVGSGP